MRTLRVCMALIVSCVLFPAMASATDEATPRGFFVQVNMPVTSISSLVSSAAGVPQFSLGIRRGHAAYGLGLGLSRTGFNTETSGGGYTSKTEMNALLFQVAPTAWIDFWRSADEQTVGNVALAFQYGRISGKTKDSFSAPSSSSSSEDKLTGNLFGFVVGVGGDHRVASNFAVGLEAGAQGVFGTDIKPGNTGAGSGGGGGGGGTKYGFSSSILYGAFRASITF